VGASERRDQLLERQRELRVRHDALGGLGVEPPYAAEHLDPLLAATDELMEVVDDMAADAARLRLVGVFVLLGVAALGSVLVAVGVLPAYALLAVLIVLAAAVVLWLTTPVPGAGR
jgi:hypothetical protein